MSDAIGSSSKTESKVVDPSDPQMSVVSAAVQTAQILMAGGVPDNEQVIATIDGTLHAVEERAREAVLNQRGKLLANDAQRILENSKRFIEEKNHDELLQKLYKDTKVASVETRNQASEFKKVTDMGSVQGQAGDLLAVVKHVIFEIAKSKDFRALLMDTVGLLQSIFWRNLNSTGTILNQEVKAQTSTQATGKLPDYMARDYKIPDGHRMVYIPDRPTENDQISENEKNKLMDKLAVILTRLSSSNEYHRAIQGVISLVEQLSLKAAIFNDESMAGTIAPTESQIRVRDDIILLVERWTGEGSLRPVLENLKKFYAVISRDPRAVAFFREGKVTLNEAFRQPDAFNEPANRQKMGRLIDQCRAIMSDPRYSSYWKDILDQISDVIRGFKDDEVSQELGDAIRNFISDMTSDANGRVSIGALQDSIVQMKSLFLPVILKQLEAIPIARMEGSNEKMDYVVDHIILSAYDVLPEMIRLNFLTVVNVDMKELATDHAKARMRLDIKNIRSHLRDIHFKFNRKTFPKLEDEGKADIDLYGEGLSMGIEWEISSENREADKPIHFVVKNVDVSVDQVAVTVKEAKHPTMDRIGIKLLSGKVRRQVEAKTREYLEKFGNQFADGLNRAIQNKRNTPRKSLAEAEREALARSVNSYASQAQHAPVTVPSTTVPSTATQPTVLVAPPVSARIN